MRARKGPLGLFLDYKSLIFVTGKGGTGKTTASLLLAGFLASKGNNVLFVELNPRSSANSLGSFGFEPTYRPKPTPWNFDCCLLGGMDCLVEYIAHFTGLDKWTQKLFENGFLKNLVNVAPGLSDLAILGKLTSHMRNHGPSFKYDHIVVDAPSTGSFQSMLQAPQTLGASVRGGPLKSQSESIGRVIKDPSQTQFLVMSLLEEIPVDELEETLGHLAGDYGSAISLVLNQKMDLDSTFNDGSPWSQFIEKKKSRQVKMSRRVLDLWESSFQLKLLGDSQPLTQHFTEGDLLRQPLVIS